MMPTGIFAGYFPFELETTAREHLHDADVPLAKAFIDGKLRQHGL